MASIEFKNISKSYGETSIIKSLDLDIQDREFMVLVGPSGCGKSTTLRMIAGLEDVSSGELLIGDQVVNQVHPKDRDVAMVFQSYALYPHMTVRENIAFGLKLRKLPKNEIAQLVDEAAETLGLQELLDRKPKALSGGQRQRVALGRAIVRQPKVFLFDEPLSNLDAELRVHMRAEISKLQKQLGITAVYVTHDQVEAMTMGDRIAVLNDGELQQVGTPLELYDTPANIFVAQFIGTPNMNIVPMRINEQRDTLSCDDFTIVLPENLKSALEKVDSSEILVGIRPEHIRREGEVDWNNKASLSGVVEIVETLGHENVIHLKLNKQSKLVVAKMDAHYRVHPGDSVEFNIHTTRLHLFDSSTGLRLNGGTY